MTVTSGVRLWRAGMPWPPRTTLAAGAFAVLAGLILALLLLVLGPLTLAIIFSLVFVLPWLMGKAFRLFIWLIISWPLLTLYIRVPLPAGIPDLSYDRILVLLLLCVVMVEAILRKRNLVRLTALDVLAILYVAAQICSRLTVMWFGGVGSPDLNGLLDHVVVPVTLFWIAKNVIVSKAQYRWVLYMLVIASLLVCPTGLYEQALGVRIFKTSVSLGGSEIEYQWQDAQGGLRAAGALANPAVYGAVLGIGSLAALCTLALVKRKPTRAALWGTIAFLLCGVFACFTRSAWLSVAIVLFTAQFFLNGLWRRTLPLMMLGLVLLILAWGMIPDTSRILQRMFTTKTVAQRLDLNQIGWERFTERPFLGWGSGALNVFDSIGAGNSSHNTYLTYLVDGGLVLFLCFAAVVGYLMIRAVGAYRTTAKTRLERNVLVAMTGSMLIFLLSGMALELKYFGYFNTLFWVCAGVIDCLGGGHGSERAANE